MGGRRDKIKINVTPQDASQFLFCLPTHSPSMDARIKYVLKQHSPLSASTYLQHFDPREREAVRGHIGKLRDYVRKHASVFAMMGDTITVRDAPPTQAPVATSTVAVYVPLGRTELGPIEEFARIHARGRLYPDNTLLDGMRVTKIVPLAPTLGSVLMFQDLNTALIFTRPQSPSGYRYVMKGHIPKSCVLPGINYAADWDQFVPDELLQYTVEFHTPGGEQKSVDDPVTNTVRLCIPSVAPELHAHVADKNLIIALATSGILSVEALYNLRYDTVYLQTIIKPKLTTTKFKLLLNKLELE